MSEAGRREARVFTAACLILGASGIASSVSPTIEGVLNVWVGVPVLVLGASWLVWRAARSLWSWALIELETRSPLQPDELSRSDEERPHA